MIIKSMKLNEKIYILRRARGYSQEQLGLSLSSSDNGVSRQTVSDWENDKSKPKLENIRALAKLLNVSYDSLLDESLDLNDTETLNRILTQGYVEDASKKKYPVFWIIFLIMIIGICSAVIIVSLINAFNCFNEATNKYNGDSTLMGKTLNNRGFIWCMPAFISLIALFVSAPMLILKIIKERK